MTLDEFQKIVQKHLDYLESIGVVLPLQPVDFLKQYHGEVLNNTQAIMPTPIGFAYPATVVGDLRKWVLSIENSLNQIQMAVNVYYNLKNTPRENKMGSDYYLSNYDSSVAAPSKTPFKVLDIIQCSRFMHGRTWTFKTKDDGVDLNFIMGPQITNMDIKRTIEHEGRVYENRSYEPVDQQNYDPRRANYHFVVKSMTWDRQEGWNIELVCLEDRDTPYRLHVRKGQAETYGIKVVGQAELTFNKKDVE